MEEESPEVGMEEDPLPEVDAEEDPPPEVDTEKDPLEVDTKEGPPPRSGGRGPAEKYCWASGWYALEKGFLVRFVFKQILKSLKYKEFLVS